MIEKGTEMKKNNDKKVVACRLGRVGGQAVLEGVMMKAGDRTVTTCRKEDGSLVVTDATFTSARKKHKILNIPIIRGIVSFIESLVLSIKTLSASAEALGIDEEENPGKVEKWLKEKLGVKITDVIMVIATILGVPLSVFLFICLPGWISYGIDALLGWLFDVRLGAFTAVVEGIVKVGIFLAYLSLVALMPDIKRTFMYHGAEHKSIACFEAGEELCPENAKKYTRFHPRCGTSFIIIVLIISILATAFINWNTWPKIAIILTKFAMIPVIVGISFEFLMWAGKHPNPVTRFLSAPGLWMQRATTKEPDASQLEVAIIALKCAMPDEFPEMAELYPDWTKDSEEKKVPDEGDGSDVQ